MKHVWLIGAIGYPCLELLWRGRTHPAMALAGGAGLTAMALAGGAGLTALRRCAQGKGGYPRRVLKGACAVTLIEYLTGLAFNRRHSIWDYRNQWGNLQGQICPAYFCAWAAIAAVITALCGKNDQRKGAG